MRRLKDFLSYPAIKEIILKFTLDNCSKIRYITHTKEAVILKKKKLKKEMKYVRYPKEVYANTIKLRCTICKEISHITVQLDWEKTYTEEVINCFICWKCRPKKKW